MKLFPEIRPFFFTHIENTESTNIYLRRLCEEKEMKEFGVVLADFQTAGRGQRGNGWESEKDKNLLFSLLLYPSFLPIKEQFLLSQLISLAVQEELSRYLTSIRIKWPNDIYWKNKKICGILIENDLSENKLQRCIAGIGININQERFFSKAPNPVSLKQITHITYNNMEILSGILVRIYNYYESLRQACESPMQFTTSPDRLSGFSLPETELPNRETLSFKEKDKAEKQSMRHKIAWNYHNVLFRKEGYHPYEDNRGKFLAKILHIEPTGILVLQDQNGKERKYAFKEISYVKEEGDHENFPSVS